MKITLNVRDDFLNIRIYRFFKAKKPALISKTIEAVVIMLAQNDSIFEF